MKQLREVKIFFENNDVIHTNMASHVTDDEIRAYYKPGKQFNLGAENDLMIKVVRVEIIK